MNNDGGMRPKLGDTMLSLPVTFDYSGGRKDARRSRNMWAVIVSVIGCIVGLGTIFNRNGSMFKNVFFGIMIIFVTACIVRFLILKEGKIRKEQITLKDKDYQGDYKDLWGIYSISNEYPYICRFRNGKSGVFVRLNKDVILGKYSESEYEHYEAIGDALNIAGKSRVQICHLDYMDNVGADERIEESFANLSRVSNKDLRDLLTDTFSYLQRQMMMRVTTFDVYVFLWTGSDINAWNVITRILACFLQANYRNFHVLDSSDMRELAKIINNFHDFSVMDASANAFTVEGYRGVVPIRMEYPDGSSEKLNKTIKEKREEAEQKRKEEEAKKHSRKKNKKQEKPKNDDDMFDLL